MTLEQRETLDGLVLSMIAALNGIHALLATLPSEDVPR